MKKIILFLTIMASSFSELDGSILRDTTNPPLTNKGSELTYGEFDGNFVKQYNAIQDIVSGENVTAYDAGATYDQYSTDIYERFASYDNRIWKATYNGSPSSFSGQTPAEGSYWTQVSLAQTIPNIMSVADIAASAIAGKKGCCMQYCTAWQEFDSVIDLQSNPVDIVGLEAPGAGKIIVPKFLLFSLDAGGTVYDYNAFGIFLAYSTAPANGFQITQAQINSATDLNHLLAIGGAWVTNDKMVMTANADASQGTGKFYIKVIYQIEDAPF